VVVLGDDNDKQVPRISLALRISLGAIVGLVLQLITLVAWLVKDHSDIAYHSGQLTEIGTRIERMDSQGTRALIGVNQRLGQIEGNNEGQDRRITRNDARIDDLIKQTQQNTFWLEQMREVIRSYAHPGATPLPRQPPP
jgi:hypothetical protein